MRGKQFEIAKEQMGVLLTLLMLVFFLGACNRGS